MAGYRNKKGWYKLKNSQKFIKPHDDYMKSFNESTGSVEFKSSLEERAFMFCDSNPKIKSWTLEPFAIKYLKPTDNKVHRYYPDLLIIFETGDTFLIEIKSSTETKPPKKPKKQTLKSEKNYKRAITTYAINSAKWKAAGAFCKEKKIRFIFLTEQQLK
jgi:hypothetical protein